MYQSIILPNGLTIEETQRQSKINTERLVMEKFAKGHYAVYKDERSPVGSMIKANADGSEDLVTVNNEGETIIVKRLSEAGHGKFAYLLKKQEFKSLNKHYAES